MKFPRSLKFAFFLLILFLTLTAIITKLLSIQRGNNVSDANALFKMASSNQGLLSNHSESETLTTTFWENASSSDQGRFKYIINNAAKCQTAIRVRLVIVIISAPNNFVSRLSIRNTWGTVSFRKDVAMVFLLGATTDTSLQNKILEENNLYEDIVQEDFIDSYRNLTLKSIALLRWTKLYCKNAKFILKVDDDNFVHGPNLLDFLEEKKNATKTIFGNLVSNTRPIRDKNFAKWYVSEDDFHGDIYPDYIGGPAYLLTNDSVQGLLDATNVLKFLYIEDVFITGICAQFANISRIGDRRFVGRLDSINSSDPLAYRKLITLHSLPSSSYFKIWTDINVPLNK